MIRTHHLLSVRPNVHHGREAHHLLGEAERMRRRRHERAEPSKRRIPRWEASDARRHLKASRGRNGDLISARRSRPRRPRRPNSRGCSRVMGHKSDAGSSADGIGDDVMLVMGMQVSVNPCPCRCRRLTWSLEIKEEGLSYGFIKSGRCCSAPLVPNKPLPQGYPYLRCSPIESSWWHHSVGRSTVLSLLLRGGLSCRRLRPVEDGSAAGGAVLLPLKP